MTADLVTLLREYLDEYDGPCPDLSYRIALRNRLREAVKQPATPPRSNEHVTAQHEETGRMWEGPRSQIPPRFFEVKTSNQRADWELLVRSGLTPVQAVAMRDDYEAEIERLHGRLGAAEQHVKVLREQVASFAPAVETPCAHPEVAFAAGTQCTTCHKVWVSTVRPMPPLGDSVRSPQKTEPEPKPCEHLRSELLAEKQSDGEPVFEMRRCLDCGKAFRVRTSRPALTRRALHAPLCASIQRSVPAGTVVLPPTGPCDCGAESES